MTTSVSGKTTYLLVGTDCGKSKYTKAKVGRCRLTLSNPSRNRLELSA
jgi:BRCT domain type II-containing protein